MTLVATNAAFAALGIDPQDAPAEDESGAPDDSREAAKTPSHKDSAQGQVARVAHRCAPQPGRQQAGATHYHAAPGQGSYHRRDRGALSWQPHTVRGAIAGALKKLGLEVTSEKDEKRGRVYRVTI